jgi:DNA invertase Pin-like site-specific DNA recombinase
MTSPQGEMMAGILSVFAQFERRLIGERTKAGMAVRKAQGVKIGRPVQLADDVRARLVVMRASGLSYPAIAQRLNAEGVPTARGRAWYPSTVHGVVNRWYRDNSQPIGPSS